MKWLVQPWCPAKVSVSHSVDSDLWRAVDRIPLGETYQARSQSKDAWTCVDLRRNSLFCIGIFIKLCFDGPGFNPTSSAIIFS